MGKKKEEALKPPIELSDMAAKIKESLIADLVELAIKRTTEFRDTLKPPVDSYSERAIRMGTLLTKADLGCKDEFIRALVADIINEPIPAGLGSGKIPYPRASVIKLAYAGKEDQPPGIERADGWYTSGDLQKGDLFLVLNRGEERAMTIDGRVFKDFPHGIGYISYIEPASDEEASLFVRTLAANAWSRILKYLEAITQE